MEEARGSIIPFIIAVNYYALQTILDIIALGIVLNIIGGFHRYIPLINNLFLNYTAIFLTKHWTYKFLYFAQSYEHIVDHLNTVVVWEKSDIFLIPCR